MENSVSNDFAADQINKSGVAGIILLRSFQTEFL